MPSLSRTAIWKTWSMTPPPSWRGRAGSSICPLAQDGASPTAALPSVFANIGYRTLRMEHWWCRTPTTAATAAHDPGPPRVPGAGVEDADVADERSRFERVARDFLVSWAIGELAGELSVSIPIAARSGSRCHRHRTRVSQRRYLAPGVRRSGSASADREGAGSVRRDTRRPAAARRSH